MRHARSLALVLVAAFIISALPTLAQTLPGVVPDPSPRGIPVAFNLQKYDDTLFASITTAYRVAFDDNGDIWYSTEAGAVHLDLKGKTRELYTHEEGLPSSLALGLATDGNKVYVGTDLGVAVIDRTTHAVTRQLRFDNSALPDDIIHDVTIDGQDVLLGTHFAGIATWNRTTDKITTKNTSTTPDYAKPVRRVVATPTAIWAGTDGDGAWKYDRATGKWTVLLKSDGLQSNSVLSFAELGGKTYIGTDSGLVEYLNGAITRKWNKTNGMPDDRVYDLDIIPRADGSGSDLWAATRGGMWQFAPDTGANQTYAQSWGLMGSYVWDDVYSDAFGWAFGTTLGVSHANETGWKYYSTGPNNAPSPGPLHYRFTAAYAADGLVWAGNELGVSAFQPSAGPTQPGIWHNLGDWQAYPGGQVNAIKRYGNTTWFATSTEAVGYNTQNDTWQERKVTGSRNVVYGLDAAQGELWIGLFGDGLIMQNLTTGLTRFWNSQSTPTPLPDPYITDVHIDGNTVWLGAKDGVIQMDRISGAFKGTYTTADGIPGSGIVFRALPDGPVVYVGTKDGGVGRLDIASGKVDKVWDNKTVPNFPMSEVRDLYREGGRLWVGTKDGLARINVTTGEATLWNQSNSKLVQNFVSGITSQDGILYMATASGIARMDIATSTFLPMRDGPGSQRGTGGDATHTTFTAPVNIRIDSPRDGVGVTGSVLVRGAANRLGGTIDRVDVQVGDGPWRLANGTDTWSFVWDSTSAPPDKQITLRARAISGTETSRIAEILVTPVASPLVPLQIEHVPITSKSAGQAILLGATIRGDEPLAATAYYKVPGRDAYEKLDLVRQGSIFIGTIPGRQVTQGTLQYYIEARSGLLSVTSPEDAGVPYAIGVGPPARVAVSIEGPSELTAQAGATTRFALIVTNVGTEKATYAITGSGLRASWLTVPADPLTLGPGESVQVNASLDIPIRAFADNTTLQFQVEDLKGEAQSAEARVPVRVLSAPEASPSVATPPAKSPIPFSPVVALGGIAVGALALRRWRN